MSARQLAGFARRLVQPKTANYTVTKADVASVILATGSNSWTLSLPAVASVNNGFIVTLKNAGTGDITIDPNGSETVNGVTTLGCYQQDSVDLICDGTGWQALFQSPFSIVRAATTSGALATIDLSLPSEFSKFTLELDQVGPVSNGAAFGMRVSLDGGATFANASYAYNGSYDSTGTTNSTTYKSSATVFAATGFELTAGTMPNTAGFNLAGTVEIYPRSIGRSGTCKWNMTHVGVSYRSAGYLGGNLVTNFTAIRLLYNTGNIAAGANYKLIGLR